MTGRQRVLDLVESSEPPGYIPAAFFLHFGREFRRGRPAVEKHMEYFRATGMDLVKIQYEHHFPVDPGIVRPADWKNVRKLDRGFFAEPLDVVKGLVKEGAKEAPVVVTLYSPFMFASQVTSRKALAAHLAEDPEAVKPGLEIVTESMLDFVRGCMEAGVDGFYASTQGGEAGFLASRELFEEYVKPWDLAVWEVIDRSCRFNILHVCDYEGPYEDLSPFTEYPGHVVNSSLELSGRSVTPDEVSALFGRPFMGGLDRHGVLSKGPEEAIREAAEEALRRRPSRFILGADCTVPADTPWANLKTAIDAAHRFEI